LLELRHDDRIVLLEASTVANGPAGRNSGFMIDVPHDLASDGYGGNADEDHRDIQLNRAGIQFALSIKEAYCMSDEAINLCGKVNGAVTARGTRHNDGYAKHLESLSESYTRLSASDMQALTGSRSYVDGLFTPGTAMLQPAMYIRVLAEGVETDGVQLYENSPVISLDRRNGRWHARTPCGEVKAKKIILGVNGHLESFGYFNRQLMHVYTYGSMTEQLNNDQNKRLGGHASWALTPADPLGTTVRRISGTGGDRIIVRNTATFDPSLRVSESRLRSIARVHDGSFRQRFPQLNMSYAQQRPRVWRN